MTDTYKPMFARGEIDVEFSTGVVRLSLTPRACCYIEQKTGLGSYMDALTELATGDGDQVKIITKNVTPIIEALLEAAGHPTSLADELNPFDAAMIVVRLRAAHIRPMSEDADPPKAAGIA